MRRAFVVGFLAAVLPVMAVASSTVDFTYKRDFLAGADSHGIPQGVLFRGVFNGPATWTLVPLPDGTQTYTLRAVDIRKPSAGFSTNDAKLEMIIDTGKGFYEGSPTISTGDTSIAVPELGTLGLLGTGLVGIAGLLRHRKR